ncbi:MAG TPA: hypothetical protein VLQ79_01530 [Myxococcaceae bacterium]|nr:hypothetical protein [Myxococcaceae bacterium]
MSTLPEGTGRRGEGEVLNKKKDAAVRFIQEIQRMDPRQLHAMITREAGEDLAQFFMSYSATLIARDPERVLQNGSSLMLMGYLIRTQEERGQRPAFEQPLACA